jgi:hypothetical protein
MNWELALLIVVLVAIALSICIYNASRGRRSARGVKRATPRGAKGGADRTVPHDLGDAISEYARGLLLDAGPPSEASDSQTSAGETARPIKADAVDSDLTGKVHPAALGEAPKNVAPGERLGRPAPGEKLGRPDVYHPAAHHIEKSAWASGPLVLRPASDEPATGFEQTRVNSAHKRDNLASKKRTEPRGEKSPSAMWETYPSWTALKSDPTAWQAYQAEREEVLANPDLDWSRVMADLQPCLSEPREYIGLVGLAPDKKTLRLIAYEASPSYAGDDHSETTFAGIPSDLVLKYATRPAMFLVHTHPADHRCSPLPSSPDLSTAIRFGVMRQFAAFAVVSRYGVLVHGVEPEQVLAIEAAKDWRLATLAYVHDVVSSHEAIRSWRAYNLDDYIDFYERMRMFLLVYPTPEFVADKRRDTYLWSLEAPTDLELIAELSADIVAYRSRNYATRPLSFANPLSAPPLDKRALSLDKRALSLGKRAPPLDKRAPPLDKRTPPLDKRAPPLDKRALSA